MPEQQTDRQQDRDVLGRAQPDQLEHEAALVLQLRGARQHVPTWLTNSMANTTSVTPTKLTVISRSR